MVAILDLSNRNDFSYILLEDAPLLPTKAGVNVQFGSGEEEQNIWRPSWISNRIDFRLFISTSCPDTSYQVSRQIGLSVQKKKRKIEFQDGGHLGHPNASHHVPASHRCSR